MSHNIVGQHQQKLCLGPDSAVEQSQIGPWYSSERENVANPAGSLLYFGLRSEEQDYHNPILHYRPDHMQVNTQLDANHCNKRALLQSITTDNAPSSQTLSTHRVSHADTRAIEDNAASAATHVRISKKGSIRPRFSSETIAKYEAFFQVEPKPSGTQKESLRQKTGLKSATQVYNWVRKRRVKAKRQKKPRTDFRDQNRDKGSNTNGSTHDSIHRVSLDMGSSSLIQRIETPSTSPVGHIDTGKLPQVPGSQYLIPSCQAVLAPGDCETIDTSAPAHSATQSWQRAYSGPTPNQNLMSVYHTSDFLLKTVRTERTDPAAPRQNLGLETSWRAPSSEPTQSHVQPYSDDDNVGKPHCFCFSNPGFALQSINIEDHKI